MEEIRDRRKYVKTAFVSKNQKTVLIVRMNQSTKVDYIVLMDYDVWVSFRKDRNETTLRIAGFSKEQIAFLSMNKLTGERKYWPKKEKKLKFKPQYRI